MHVLHHKPIANALHRMNGDYHFRVPQVLHLSGWLGIVILIASVIWTIVAPSSYGVVAVILGIALLLPTIVVRAIIRSLLKRRFRVRDGIVAHAALCGDEQVLDVGVGSGITLFGLVGRLTTGKGVGIDTYDPNAGGGNAETFWKNADKEGLRERVELKHMDARAMSFADESFDVVVSTFAFHHIGDGESRRKAAQEMLRVLKPGGRVLVYDVGAALNELEQVMRGAGLHVHRHGGQFSMIMGQKS
jgi:arsenite methyltransferase